ncbi:MAG: bifunctional folylpolyglutamate synthase/dihydrofolate synthase [Clostridia bacterium]|nr:bifunctional folylpolyglutamate synthase/dihydrofolate synthase [Clostridia bacterium]
MNFNEAINYLQNLTKFGINLGLGRIEELLRRLDNPHQKLKVIHIGGTNGKGSTTAMVSSILQAAGYKVGTFTSPHLHSYTERYRINREEVAPDRIAGLISRFKPILEEMVAAGFEHPTEFEVSTALAFQYFHEEQVDLLVLEVGLGGSIDSTNVVTPLVSIITNVAMDHMDYLGDTIEEIATVKAGIIKPGIPVVTATEKPEVLEIIAQTAAQKDSRLVVVGRDVTWQDKGGTLDGQVLDVHGLNAHYQQLAVPLLGQHQLINAATAVAGVELLVQQGYKIDEMAIIQGLGKTMWPARLEIMQRRPMVVIDGAHNLDGARKLAQALRETFQYRELILVFGMLGDKEREKVVAQLAPLAKRVVITKPNSPRAGDWQQIKQEVDKYVGEVYLIEDIRLAVEKGLALAGEEDLVCITGSLYMVAEAREYWVKEVHK